MMNLKRIAQWNGENGFSCLYDSYSDYLEEMKSVDPFLTDEEFEKRTSAVKGIIYAIHKR